MPRFYSCCAVNGRFHLSSGDVGAGDSRACTTLPCRAQSRRYASRSLDAHPVAFLDQRLVVIEAERAVPLLERRGLLAMSVGNFGVAHLL